MSSAQPLPDFAFSCRGSYCLEIGHTHTHTLSLAYRPQTEFNLDLLAGKCSSITVGLVVALVCQSKAMTLNISSSGSLHFIALESSLTFDLIGRLSGISDLSRSGDSPVTTVTNKIFKC